MNSMIFHTTENLLYKTKNKKISKNPPNLTKIISEEPLYYISPHKINEINPANNCCINYTTSFILQDDIIENLPRHRHNSREKISFDLITSCILIIDFRNLGGGTSVFIESIIHKYKNHQTFLIARNFGGKVYFTINDEYELDQPFGIIDSVNILLQNKDKIEKIFVNHTIGHSDYFLNSLFTFGKHITTITHDTSLILKKWQCTFNDLETNINDKTLHNTIDINNYDQIITQNIANLHVYNKFINDKNKIVITPLPDFTKTKEQIRTANKTIIIGIIGHISEIKGLNVFRKIVDYYKNINENVKFINFCPYKNIDDLNKLLKLYEPNMLLELSICGETYSYTLTLSMLTQLPILYLKKNNLSVVENRLSTYINAYSFKTLNELTALIKEKKQNYFYTIEPVIYFNDWWDNYFITKKNKTYRKETKNKFNIKTYCTYFPQFHEIKENNKSFYPGFTDVTNLKLLNEKFEYIDIETPNVNEFCLNKITDYNLLNKNIIQKQIDIMEEYNISGIAMYYYWFETNTITGNNEIMEKVVNSFFDYSINLKNKKIFFIWANESWTDNPAFGTNDDKIETNYSDPEIINKFADKMMSYFKHYNYLKIDNKPILSIHHPWCIGKNIDLLYDILNKKCLSNNYNGIQFIMNSMGGLYDRFINNHHTFNYKNNTSTFYSETNKQIYLDFKKYITTYRQENKCDIYTLALDFDNRARLIKPDKLAKSTICVNNNEFNKTLFIKKIINKYNRDKKSDVENILIINAWNEWGEKMHMEPSNEYGYYNLNLIRDILLE